MHTLSTDFGAFSNTQNIKIFHFFHTLKSVIFRPIKEFLCFSVNECKMLHVPLIYRKNVLILHSDPIYFHFHLIVYISKKKKGCINYR